MELSMTRDNLKLKRIPLIGLVIIAVLGAALLTLQFWNAKSVQNSLNDLKSSGNVRSVGILAENRIGSELHRWQLERSQIDELLGIMSNSHTPWRKEKKLYDYTFIASIVTNTDTTLRVTFFVDANSDIVNYQVANNFGVQTFWADVKDSFFRKLVRTE